MWTHVLHAAAADSVPTSTIVVALIAAAAAILAAVFSARGTFKSVDSQREIAYNKRVDERNAQLEADKVKLEERNEHLKVDRDKYRELYAELRLAVIANGMDPDDLVGQE